MVINDIFSLGELFEQVQMQQIFPDGKTFVDCVPKQSFSSIQDSYEVEKRKTGFNLYEFVHEHFIPPQEPSSKFESDKTQPVAQHINILWNELTKKPDKITGSLIPLPFSYIVPGGRFREIYYWDSYFTLLGLQVSGRDDLIENMVNNFSFLIDRFSYIPNGNRTYYLGRSQPPFYACMVNLLSKLNSPESKDEENNILVKYLPQLRKEYNFWMNGHDALTALNNSIRRVVLLPNEIILNRYWDENNTPRPESFKEDSEHAKSASDKKAMYRHIRAAAESGWDFSSRWFKNGKDFSTIHTTEIIPVDLNCLLYNLENTIADACQLNNDKDCFIEFKTAIEKRKEAINKYCWNEEKGFYFDYDYVTGTQKTTFSLAAAFPLFFKIATDEQAGRVAQILEKKFLYTGGLISTTASTGQQWDAPNGWAPLHWIAIRGLAKYGYEKLAKNIGERWMKSNEKVYADTGKMMEKYNVVTTDTEAGGGEYPAQDGFGWTNGVYLALSKWRDQ